MKNTIRISRKKMNIYGESWYVKLWRKLQSIHLSALLCVGLLVVALPPMVWLATRKTKPNISAAAETVDLLLFPTNVSLSGNETTTFSLNMDAKSNKVVFAKITLRFDPTKVQLASEINTSNRFQAVISKSTTTQANTTGTVTFILALYDPIKNPPPAPTPVPPSGVFELARLTFKSSTTSNNQTSIEFLNDQIQIADQISNGDVATPFSPNQAIILLNPTVTTSTSATTPRPTLKLSVTPKRIPTTDTYKPTGKPIPTPGQNEIVVDINGDGCVNITDIRIIWKAFMSKSTYNMDSKLDVNKDGKLSWVDIMTVMRHWKEGCGFKKTPIKFKQLL